MYWISILENCFDFFLIRNWIYLAGQWNNAKEPINFCFSFFLKSTPKKDQFNINNNGNDFHWTSLPWYLFYSLPSSMYVILPALFHHPFPQDDIRCIYSFNSILRRFIALPYNSLFASFYSMIYKRFTRKRRIESRKKVSEVNGRRQLLKHSRMERRRANWEKNKKMKMIKRRWHQTWRRKSSNGLYNNNPPSVMDNEKDMK